MIAAEQRRGNLGLLVQLFCWLGLGFIFTLGVLSLLLHYQTDTSAAAQYFSSKEIETGLRYGFESKLLGWGNRFVNLAFLAAMALTSWGRRLTDWCRHAADRFVPRLATPAGALPGQPPMASGRWFPTLLLLTLALYAAQELLSLPFSVASYYHSLHWGVTERGLGDWFVDYLKGLGVSTVMEVPPILALFLLIRWLPRAWWVIASAAALLYGVAIAFFYPIVVAPLFNTFTPLDETRWAHLEPRVRQLLDKAALPIEDILVVDASRQSSHSNAYFTGFGATRRIVLYDTLLANQSPDEVISVLAHEIGHWQHDHIVKGLAMAAAGAVVALFLLSRLLLGLVGQAPWRLESPSDPAVLPLLLLLTVVVMWLSMPIQNGVSRYFERQADEASLELGGQPQAFINAEIKLCRTNRSNVAPHPILSWFFSTHPTALERIDMAEGWRKKTSQKE